MPHGVDHARFAPERRARDADDLARLARARHRPPYIAFAGTIEPRKDVPDARRTRSRASPPPHPTLRLVLAGGDGWGVDAARDAIAASGVATASCGPATSTTTRSPRCSGRPTAVAYPSLEEGFGLPALEALACGTPLVTTTGSALEEVVGDAALLVHARRCRRARRRARGASSTTTRSRPRLRAAGPERARRRSRGARSIDGHIEAYRARGVGCRASA